MMISQMSNYGYNSSINNMQKAMIKLATSQKINSAADGAAELSITEKMKSQSNGYEMASRNGRDAQSLSDIAEGGLSSIQDSLQRMRELTVKASNGIYSDEDKKLIQTEIDQIKESITDQAEGTTYNSISLLNNNDKIGLAINNSGDGMSMQLTNSSLDALGIKDFDITKGSSVRDIDNAIAAVTRNRVNFGTTSNVLDYATDSNDITNHNIIASMSRMRDTDYGQASTEYNSARIINQYSLMAMQSSMQQNAILAQV